MGFSQRGGPGTSRGECGVTGLGISECNLSVLGSSDSLMSYLCVCKGLSCAKLFTANQIQNLGMVQVSPTCI